MKQIVPPCIECVRRVSCRKATSANDQQVVPFKKNVEYWLMWWMDWLNPYVLPKYCEAFEILPLTIAWKKFSILLTGGKEETS